MFTGKFILNISNNYRNTLAILVHQTGNNFNFILHVTFCTVSEILLQAVDSAKTG